MLSSAIETFKDRDGNKVIEVFSDLYNAHVHYISDHLRAEDFNEVFASTGESPHHAVLLGWNMSLRRWIIFNKHNVPVAVLGVYGANVLFGDVGIPWLLGTYGLDEMKRFFMMMSRVLMEEMTQRFKLLINFVDARYERAVRWLKWCGFTIEAAAPHGALGLPFHKFYMERA